MTATPRTCAHPWDARGPGGSAAGGGLGARVTAVLGPRLLAKGFAAPRAEDPGTDARAEEAGLITRSSSCQTFSVHPFFVIVTCARSSFYFKPSQDKRLSWPHFILRKPGASIKI